MVAGLARRDAPRRVPLAMRGPRALSSKALTVLFDRRGIGRGRSWRTRCQDRAGSPDRIRCPRARSRPSALHRGAQSAGRSRRSPRRPPTPPAGESSEMVRVFWWTRVGDVSVWNVLADPAATSSTRAATEGRGTSPGGTCDTVWLPRTGNGCWSARTRACWKRWPSLTQMELAWSAPWGVRTSSRKSRWTRAHDAGCALALSRRLRLAGSRHGERGASPVRRVSA